MPKRALPGQHPWVKSLAFSPDGKRIAFMSNHSDDPDRDPSAQLYVADATPGATEKQLTPVSIRAGRARPVPVGRGHLGLLSIAILFGPAIVTMVPPVISVSMSCAKTGTARIAISSHNVRRKASPPDGN